MLRLDKAINAWGTPDFGTILKQEIENLDVEYLPLQQGLVNSNYVADTPISVMINSVAELESVIRIRAGIFYRGVMGGCSCADDPTPISENEEYCQISLQIDKSTAIVEITLTE